MPILCLDVKSKRCALSNNKFLPSISNLTASPTENNNPGVRTTFMLIYIWSCNHKFASISLFQNPYICRTGSSAYDKHHNNVTATILRCPQQTKVSSSSLSSLIVVIVVIIIIIITSFVIVTSNIVVIITSVVITDRRPGLLVLKEELSPHLCYLRSILLSWSSQSSWWTWSS